MKEVSVDEILENYNLIVPEIQREYVWGFNQYGIFETFIKDIQDGFRAEGEISPEMLSLQDTIDNPAIDDTTRKSLIGVLERLKKPRVSLNIGFLYSYKPGYYIGDDREEDLYLIDGQQRFTTLFLILFYFALREGRKTDFESLFKFDENKEKIAFDYRVRSVTHQFIIDLISKSVGINDLIEMRNKQWFLAKYANDVTVKSIAGTKDQPGVFSLLDLYFKSDNQPYFDFVRKDIKFWHFKTEETSQGEELYITMNSRGQQLADNETIRAKLFDNDEVKNNALVWSEKWENWQDFFWKKRYKAAKGFTADEGFNEFLRWVQILQMYKQNQNLDVAAFEKVLKWEQGSKLDVKYLSLAAIENTFSAVRYLFESFMHIIDTELKYQYVHCTDFNLIPANWLGNKNGTIGQIDLFQLLPALLYCIKHIEFNVEVKPLDLLRLVRTLNSLSQDETIGKAIRDQIYNVLVFADSLECGEDIIATLSKPSISKTILNEEIRTKLEIYRDSVNRVLTEDLFWFAEDLDWNKGEIKHIIDYINLCYTKVNNIVDIEIFKDFTYTFKELLENEEEIWGDLLATDVYVDSWDRVTWSDKWYKTIDFLKFTNNRRINKQITLSDFLVSHRKEFVRHYPKIESMIEETDSRKQLYLFYIIQTNLLKSPETWWKNSWNFGKHSGLKDFSTIFHGGNIYQAINTHFRHNLTNVLWIHQKHIHKKIPLAELLAWSNIS